MKKKSILLMFIGISIATGIYVPNKYTYIFFEKFGYYYALFLFAIWTRSLVRFISINNYYKYKEIIFILLSSFALMTIIFSISNPRFKVLSDEANLIGVSMAMHKSQKSLLPISGFDFEYKKPEYNYILDKRPLVYPVLVSFVHSMTGYSIYNGFIVNFFAGLFIIFTFYFLSRCFFSAIDSVYSILLLSSMPGFIIWVTSGGFETVNLFFIVFSLFLLSKILVEKKLNTIDVYSELLVVTLAMLSQCRYESIVFSIFFIVIILTKRIVSNLTITGMLSPILFIPSLWHPRLYADNPDINKIGDFFVQAPNLYESFKIGNLIDNSRQNLMVFLGMDPYLGFSPFISVSAILGVFLCTRNMMKNYKLIDFNYKILYTMFISTFSFIYIVQFSFYRGDLSIYTQNRFSISYFPYIVLSSIYFIIFFQKKYSIKKESLISLIVIHMFYFYSFGSQQRSTNIGSLPYEYEKILLFMEKEFNENLNILTISDHPNLYVLKFRGSVDFDFANKNIEKINRYEKEFDHVIFFQKMSYKNNLPLEGNVISNDYKLKEISKIKLSQSTYIRVHEIL